MVGPTPRVWLSCALLVIAGGLGYAWFARGEPYAVRPILMDAREAVGIRSADSALSPSFADIDALPRLAVRLEPVAKGFTRPTDLAFVGDTKPALIVLEQQGKVSRVDLRTGRTAAWFSVDVEHQGNEQGLLGVAFHPRFADNGRLFVNSTRRANDATYSFVTEYRAKDSKRPFAAEPERVGDLLELLQPYPNHNGGALTFGPDGMLYIAFGDGGSANDPQGHGQNRKSWLGSILRIDIDEESPPLAYRVPPDNPFVADASYAPETFVVGVRNPWRISFDPKGRLIVADVGQNRWEEVGYALPGDNLGWAIMEGKVCFGAKSCNQCGLRLPFLVYGREQGISVTGGYVVTSTSEGALSGLYVYGDYASGRIWAAALPEPGNEAERVFTTGAWPILPSTFGRDRHGRMYVADHRGGAVYRIVANK